jgi:hypothetical protein
MLRDIASKLPVRPNGNTRRIWMIFIARRVAQLSVPHESAARVGECAINVMFWLGVAMGGVVFARSGCNGRWAGPVQHRRIARRSCRGASG